MLPAAAVIAFLIAFTVTSSNSNFGANDLIPLSDDDLTESSPSSNEHCNDIEQGKRGQPPLEDITPPPEKKHRRVTKSPETKEGDKNNDNPKLKRVVWRCNNCTHFRSSSFDDCLSHEKTCNGAQPEPAATASAKQDDDDDDDESMPFESSVQYNHEDVDESNVNDNTMKFRHKPAGESRPEEGGDGFVKVNWDSTAKDVPIHPKFGLYCREGEIGEKDRKLAAEVIGKRLVWLFFVNVVVGSLLYCGWRIALMLFHMMNSMKVFVTYSMHAKQQLQEGIRTEYAIF